MAQISFSLRARRNSARRVLPFTGGISRGIALLSLVVVVVVARVKIARTRALSSSHARIITPRRVADDLCQTILILILLVSLRPLDGFLAGTLNPLLLIGAYRRTLCSSSFLPRMRFAPVLRENRTTTGRNICEPLSFGPSHFGALTRSLSGAQSFRSLVNERVPKRGGFVIIRILRISTYHHKLCGNGRDAREI